MLAGQAGDGGEVQGEHGDKAGDHSQVDGDEVGRCHSCPPMYKFSLLTYKTEISKSIELDNQLVPFSPILP